VVSLLILKGRVDSEWFKVFGTGFFDESDLSQVRLGQSLSFPTRRLWTGSAVLEGSEGGDYLEGPQAVTPRRENTSGTPGTTSDNHFRSAVATLEIIRAAEEPHPEHMDGI